MQLVYCRCIVYIENRCKNNKILIFFFFCLPVFYITDVAESKQYAETDIYSVHNHYDFHLQLLVTLVKLTILFFYLKFIKKDNVKFTNIKKKQKLKIKEACCIKILLLCIKICLKIVPKYGATRLRCQILYLKS